jgi:hypothetical protein
MDGHSYRQWMTSRRVWKGFQTDSDDKVLVEIKKSSRSSRLLDAAEKCEM